jgi:BlaI family penicillinase repressor
MTGQKQKKSCHPHKNTVATILKTMVDKGFVRVETLGRIHRYHPAVSKDNYSRDTLTSVAKGYFDGFFRRSA